MARRSTPRTGIRRLARPLVVIPMFVLLAAGAAGWVLVVDDDEAPAAGAETTEQIVEVTVEDISQTVSAEGTIEAETTADLAFDVSGTVTEVLVEAGDEVAVGDPLARIDSSELEAAVVEAEAAVDDAEAALAEVTDSDSDASDTEVAAREAQVESASVDLVTAVEDLAGATLTAPVDGSVASVSYEVGDVLGSEGTDGTDMTGSDTGSAPTADTGESDQGEETTAEGIQVVSTGTYVVTIEVDATEVDQLEEGQTAQVTPTTSSSSSGSTSEFPTMGDFGGSGGAIPSESGGETDEAEAAGEEVEGTVTSVGAVASTDSGVATFAVEITVEGSADEFFPGALAEVEIVYDEITDAVTVPSNAVQQVDGQETVTVADGDDREERAVTTGVTSGSTTEILEGLEAGEQVVIEMPSFGGTTSGEGGDGETGPTGDGSMVMPEGS